MSVWLYIAVMAGVTYAIRVLPLALIRRDIKSRRARAFLHYVPYATLAAMTFPAVLRAAESPISGACALAASVVLAWRGCSPVVVALAASVAVFVVERIAA